jgi:Outer membrane protein beta-barrel domain
MRNSIWVLTLLALFGSLSSANAQEQTSQFEAYGGYDYIRFNVHSNINGVISNESYNSSGGTGQLEFNANRWLGILGELGGYVVTKGEPVAGTFTYLFGPRVNFQRGKFTPYTQVLVGGMVATGEIGQNGAANHFALAAGGGLDIRISRYISIRPVQAEYLMTKFPDGINNRQDNFRFSAGIVFRFSPS